MNKARSNKLNKIFSKLEDINQQLGEILASEQEYYESLSEKAQEGEKGEKSQSSISQLEDAVNYIDSAMSEIENAKLSEDEG